MMNITIEDDVLKAKFKEYSGREPTEKELFDIKEMLGNDVTEWIITNVKSFVESNVEL